jgi:hypothetical protein
MALPGPQGVAGDKAVIAVVFVHPLEMGTAASIGRSSITSFR